MRRNLLLLCVLSQLVSSDLYAQKRTSVTPAQSKAKELKSLKASLHGDAYAAGVLRNVLKSPKRSIASTGGTKSRLADRKVWVPLGVDPEIRKVTVGTILQKMNVSSKRLKTLIKQDPSNAVWDVIFVGAGVHTAVAANSLGNKKNPLTMLTIESSSQVANTFRGLGDTLARNSANRAESAGAKIERGFGNKNPSIGPWGDPDLSGGEWPGVKGFADVATINLFTSGSDFLMKTRVVKVQERSPQSDWPARYRLSLSDGSRVYASQIVSGTGIGVPKISLTHKPSLALIKKTRGEINYKKPNRVPTITTAEEALRLANLSATGRDPYRGKARANGSSSSAVKRITALITGKLGSKKIGLSELAIDTLEIEDADGNDVSLFVPEITAIRKTRSGYRIETQPGPGSDTRAQVVNTVRSKAKVEYELLSTTGFVDRSGAKKIALKDIATSSSTRPTIAVIGGGDSARTFLEYLYGQAPESAYTGPGKRDTAQRGDIGDILWAVGENGPADCESFLDSTRSRYLRLAGKVREVEGSPSRAQLITERLSKVKKLSNGKYKVTLGGETAIVDRVVFATGYKSKSLDIFEKGGISNAANLVPGKVKGLSGKRNLAKKLSAQDIYLLGPAAGTGVIGDDELFETKENQASLYAYAQRDRSLMKIVNKEARLDQTMNTTSIYEPSRVTLFKSARRQTTTLVRRSRERSRSRQYLEATSLKSVVLKSEMGSVLEGFSFLNFSTLKITVQKGEDKELRISVPLAGRNLELFKNAIEENAILMHELTNATATGRPLGFDVQVSEPGRDAGQVQLESLTMTQ